MRANLLRGLGRSSQPENFAGAPKPTGENFLFGIPDGPEGVRVTLGIMRKLVKLWRANPEMIAFANSLIADVPPKADREIINRIFLWVRDQIIYRNDANGVEVLRAPDVLIQQGYGDCDDKSTLLSTLLEALGYDTRFVVIGFEPDNFTHVYNEVKLGTVWVPLDSTEPVEMGWSPYDGPQPILARMNWNI